MYVKFIFLLILLIKFILILDSCFIRICIYIYVYIYNIVYSTVSHSALNDMMTLDKDKEAKKQSIVDHNEDQFYDCFDEAKTSEMLQIISK